MPIDIGSEIEGKVTGVTNFGAFVELPEKNAGLIHISQIADSYVKDVTKHVNVGDLVKVKVLGLNKAGKYDLSIKQVGKPDWQFKKKKVDLPKGKHEVGSFEDKISQFLKQSDEKISDWKRNLEQKQGGRKKKF